MQSRLLAPSGLFVTEEDRALLAGSGAGRFVRSEEPTAPRGAAP